MRPAHDANIIISTMLENLTSVKHALIRSQMRVTEMKKLNLPQCCIDKAVRCRHRRARQFARLCRKVECN